MDSNPTRTRPQYIARVARRMVSDPGEALEKIRERAALTGECFVRRHESAYPRDLDWEERLHALIGAPWPCPDAGDFDALWSEIAERMASRGLRIGRRSYGRDDDADTGLGRSLWCLVRHLRPETVVETGVAHGVSSRCLLEALERNGQGRLWSIDLPPLTIPERRAEIGAAVPEDRRARWTYVEGSSRRRLPGLLRDLGQIELFVHDSWHSTRNTRWELRTAWQALRPGGFVVADDADHNWGFRLFARAAPDLDEVLCCMTDDREGLFGLARRGRPPVDRSAA